MIGRVVTLRVLVPWPRLVDALRMPGVEPLLWHLNDDPQPPPAARLLITERPVDPARRARVRQVPGLEHVHLLSLGYEWILEHLPPGVGLSNSRGAVEDATAELCLALVLAALRELPAAGERQREHRWERTWTSSLHGSTVLLLGVGGVGAQIMARLHPFKPAGIIPVARRARRLPDGTAVHGVDELAGLLPAADVVIVALPHTTQTERLVDARFLAALSDDALVVNVGRGALVDTAALLDELASGRLRAALDVSDPEPLPPEHPLWHTGRCIITPHTGGDTGQFLRLVTELAVRQVKTLAAGEPPLNPVGG